MSEISVILVSWNARNYLRDCLQSLYKTGSNLIREVVVVDNASTDGSPDMVASEFPQAMLIRSKENLGFARANNIGLDHVSAPMVALVNTDVVVHENCLQKLLEFLASYPEVGLVGPKVFGRDGNVQLTRGRLPGIWNTLCEFLLLYKLARWCRFFQGFQIREEQPTSNEAAEVLSGCFWLARHSAVKKVGGLDERFFFYAEDVDWCKRFRDAGWKLAYVTSATATHFGGGSSSNAPLRYSIEFLRANLLYWGKHYGLLGQWAYYMLATTQHAVRLGIRGLLWSVGLAKGAYTQHKLKEHLVCLRWLITGKAV